MRFFTLSTGERINADMIASYRAEEASRIAPASVVFRLNTGEEYRTTDASVDEVDRFLKQLDSL